MLPHDSPSRNIFYPCSFPSCAVIGGCLNIAEFTCGEWFGRPSQPAAGQDAGILAPMWEFPNMFAIIRSSDIVAVLISPPDAVLVHAPHAFEARRGRSESAAPRQYNYMYFHNNLSSAQPSRFRIRPSVHLASFFFALKGMFIAAHPPRPLRCFPGRAWNTAAGWGKQSSLHIENIYYIIM